MIASGLGGAAEREMDIGSRKLQFKLRFLDRMPTGTMVLLSGPTVLHLSELFFPVG
jgi:hypothetical protein